MSDNTSLGLATKQAANIKSHGPKLAENRQSPRPARESGSAGKKNGKSFKFA